jgi:hypothetical protein
MKVYVTCFWEDDQSLFQTIKKYAFGKTTWKNLEFTTEAGFDRAVILNYHNANSLSFSPGKAIVFRLEPPGSSNYLHESESFIVPGYMHWPFLHKFPDEKLQQIFWVNQIKKKQLLSTVTSDLTYMDGHIERLTFIHFLDQHILEGFDVWGRNTSDKYFQRIGAYRGELKDKFDGLLDYEYHLAIENSFLKDYYTEKIADPILAECLCFYAGCSNLEEYIDERAFYRLDLSNKKQAKDSIIKAIHDGTRKKRLKYIRQQKKRLLTDLNPLNLMWLALNGYDYETKMKL